MAISPDLAQFRSSGVYRTERDRSQIPNTFIPNTTRLMIGFSKKGPFNTPVLIQDAQTFVNLFGEIDKSLERKGSFFHRSVLQALSRGPVIVINIYSLDPDLDKSEFVGISTSASEKNSSKYDAPVQSYFDTNKFWVPSSVALTEVTKNTEYLANPLNQRLLTFANIGRKSVSIFTRKSEITGYDVLAKDWYAGLEMPLWINPNDLISDYLIDVILVEGDWTNYLSLSIDPTYSDYFNTKGLKKEYTDHFGIVRDGLTGFLSLPSVNVLGVYSGSLIPYFKTKTGSNIFIGDVVNSEVSRTGILTAVATEAFDDEFTESIGGSTRYISADLVDLIGHTLKSEQPSEVEFLSYFGSLNEDIVFSEKINPVENIVIGATPGQTGANALVTASSALVGASGYVSGQYFDTVTIYGPQASVPTNFVNWTTDAVLWKKFVDSISITDSFIQSQPFGAVSYITMSSLVSKSYDSTLDTLTLRIKLNTEDPTLGPTTTTLGWNSIENNGNTVNTTGGTFSIFVLPKNDWQDIESNTIIAGKDSIFYTAFNNGLITDGDKFLTGPTTFGYVDFIRGSTSVYNSTTSGIYNFDRKLNNVVASVYANSDFIGSPISLSGATSWTIRSFVGNINESLEIDTVLTPNSPTTTVWIDNSASGPLGLNGFAGKIQKGDFLVQNFGGATANAISDLTGKSRLTRVLSVREDTNPLSVNYHKIEIKTSDPIYILNGAIERYKEVKGFVQNLRPVYLKGWSLREAIIPDGTIERQNEILDYVWNTNLAEALKDRETISWRYLVDTFEGTIETATKSRLSRLAMEQQGSLAILNLPSVKQFKDSVVPLFRKDKFSPFDASYIPTGGNQSLSPLSSFSLPSIADGGNYSAFYGPNVVIRENGQNVYCPPAALVSNLYIDKWRTDLPYSIVAGTRRGVLNFSGVVGVEYSFDRGELDSIEPFGYNAIVNKRNFGLVINSNQTAQQNPISALSQIHVRELVIYIQDQIENILKPYRWEINNTINRFQILLQANALMQQIQDDGGVYSFVNVMDTTNNTPEIIDANIGVLDTYIEPARGMSIIVHRTTILKTGVISTGNFI